jgi:putative FmdB family regulatory protein
MPLYEYRCRKCTEDFEMLVFSDDEPVACPKCDSDKVDKQLSLPAQPVVKSLAVSDCNTSGPPCNPNCCRM